jgi:hypothetical protein
VAAEVNVVAFMAFYRIGVLDGVGLVVFIGGEAFAIVAYLAAQMVQLCTFRFRCRGGRASGRLLTPCLLRYDCK